MKLNKQIIQSRCHGPLHEAEFLDLSNLGLVIVEKLNSCPMLQTLLLQGNKLQDVSDLHCCQQLWHLDLSNNGLQSLEGLSQFLALGTLILSNNNLAWSSLACIRHMHILSLSLHGNPQLEKDPYYRIHLIDYLPNVWMLDGKIITSAERIQTKQFFQDSALSERPVRRKLKKDGFIPTAQKTIDHNGIFGKKTVQLMTTFPKNAVLNIEIDKKRLRYLAQDIQEDIRLERWNTSGSQFAATHDQKQTFLLDALEARHNSKEKGNMVLLLLAASLEFVLPTHLVKETLEKNNLYRSGSFQAMDLFLLPKRFRCRVLSLLFSALKVDKDENEGGGVYPHLYLCLHYITQEMTRINETLNYPHIKSTSDLRHQLENYKCLLALEVVQMMCTVPALFELLPSDAGVLDLVRLATDDSGFVEQLVVLCMLPGPSSVYTTMPETLHEEVAKYLLSKVHERIEKLTSKTPWLAPCDRILCKSGALPMKGENTIVFKADYLHRGAYIPNYSPPSIKPRKMSAKDHSKAPALGDAVLLGPQTLGKILSLPQSNVALILIDAVPVPSGAVERRLTKPDNHYAFINTVHLEWDYQFSLWKPVGAICDNASEGDRSDRFTAKGAIEPFDDDGQDGLQWGLNRFPGTPEAVTPREKDQHQPLRPLVYTSCHALCSSAAFPGKAEQDRPTNPELGEIAFMNKHLLRSKSAMVFEPPGVEFRVSKSAPVFPSKAEVNATAEAVAMPQKAEQNEVFLTAEGSECLLMQERRSDENLVDQNGLGQKSTDSYDQKNLVLDLAVFGDDIETDRRGTISSKGQSEVAEPHGDEEKKAEENKQATDEDVSSEQIVKTTVQVEKADDLRTSAQDDPQTIKSYQQVGGGSPITKLGSQSLETTSLRSGSEKHMDFSTEFEQQRIDAWKKTAIPSSEQKGTQSAQLPPPQPPSSPVIKDHDKGIGRENASYVNEVHFLRNIQLLRPLSVPDAGRWLGGGRDLYWESLRRRPKSSHTPGWKIGLPEGMQRRPKSAAARTMMYPKTEGIHMQTFKNRTGAVSYSPDINEFADLSDFPWLSMAQGGVRSRGSQRSLYDEDPLPGPVLDSVAR